MRRLWNALVTIVTGLAVAASFVWLIGDPNTPLPPHWNPLTPLAVADPVTPWTKMKLRRATVTAERCIASLDGHAEFETLPPLIGEGDCGIDPRVRLTSVGSSALSPLETTCAIALRLTVWERHSLQPLAVQSFGSRVARIHHQSSYSCRNIRTEAGDGSRLSTHATAEAIDIAGVTLDGGMRLNLNDHWVGDSEEAEFFRNLRDGACDWFVTVLGPDFNALHKDHFHMQSVGWGLCR